MHTRRIRTARSAWRAAGWLAFTLIVVAPATVIAQVLYGSVVGTVTDTSGAVIPGAIVTITHQERNVTREEVTDAEGNYAFSTVSTGTYTVRVALEGFQTVERENVQVTLNTVARINMKLGVSAVAETVMVAAQTPLLQTDRAEVRSEITSTDLQNLPVPLGRNYQQTFKYLPGFTPPHVEEVLAAGATAPRPNPLCRRLRRQQQLGHGGGHQLRPPRGDGDRPHVSGGRASRDTGISHARNLTWRNMNDGGTDITTSAHAEGGAGSRRHVGSLL